MNFELDEYELNKYRKWVDEHDKKCPYADRMNQGAIGGRMSFTFTPTGLGQITKIKCACGDEVDVTQYEHW